MRRKRWLLLGVALLAVAGGALAFAAVGEGSEPATQDVTVPAAGASTSVQWTGTIPVNTNPTSDCSQATGTVLNDSHGITVHVPSTGYSQLKTTFKFQISWTPANPSGDETLNDEILTVVSKEGDEADQSETREIGTSDGGDTKETVAAINLAPGDYTVMACGFVNSVPQPYTGTLTVSSVTLKSTIVKSSSAQGLAFSAAVPADPQRDEAEPLIVSDKAGLLYTCGPTGFSNAADYAQVSTDGGDQFHLLGNPPRGQQSDGGGGDCALATGETPNAQGNYAYAYAGLGALSGFSTSTSVDNGHTLDLGGRGHERRGHDERRPRRPAVGDVHRRPHSAAHLQPDGATQLGGHQVHRRGAHVLRGLGDRRTGRGLPRDRCTGSRPCTRW